MASAVKRSRTRPRWLAASVAAALVAIVTVLNTTALYILLPEGLIQSRLKQHPAANTERSVIEQVTARRGLRVSISSTEHGFLWSDGRKLGKDRIRLDLGQSRVVFSRAMEAILVFDADSRLEAIRVRKEVNAP